VSNWRPILVWEVSTIAIPGQRLRERCESDFGDVQLVLLALCVTAATALPAQTPTFKVISRFCAEKPCLLGGNPVSTPVQL
jgi:hypothetical protein